MTTRKYFIGCLIMIHIFKSTHAQAQDRVFSTLDSCYSHIEVYSRHWQKDSIGKNGFRELMANTLLEKCSFSGEEWEKIRKFIGTPNFKYGGGDVRTYRYRLNYLSRNIKDIGTMLLDVEVNSEGIVIGFSIYTVDG